MITISLFHRASEEIPVGAVIGGVLGGLMLIIMTMILIVVLCKCYYVKVRSSYTCIIIQHETLNLAHK